jgi:hypothetical protein
MEIVEAKREAVEPFLDREWRGVNLEQFGRLEVLVIFTPPLR